MARLETAMSRDHYEKLYPARLSDHESSSTQHVRLAVGGVSKALSTQEVSGRPSLGPRQKLRFPIWLPMTACCERLRRLR
jgi:hypothetical protein